MRLMLVLVVALCLAGSAAAVQNPTGARLNTDGKGASQGNGATSPRTGGDTIAQATIIPALPFSDTGATCGFADNYDEVCPYSGSTSADVVYAFTPTAAQPITVDLCASQYDTKVYVYAGGVGTLVACNDDAGCGYSGYQSRIVDLALTAGTTYYIVVDGYGGACGTYQMQVSTPVPCSVTCPPYAVYENEPDCYDGYYDTYNGGCNSSGWVTLYPQSTANSVDMCGKSGTYIYNGYSYRDTDWYDTQGSGDPLMVNCIAEFPLQIILIYGTDCDNLQYDYTTAGPCDEASLSRVIGLGVPVWVWVGPSVFSGVPCGSDYTLHVDGLCGNLPGASGACCLPNGSCIYAQAVQCGDFLQGIWLGSCVDCATQPCAAFMGACCHPDGTCSMSTSPGCLPPDTWMGTGSVCTPINPCSPPTPLDKRSWGRIKSAYR